MPEPQHEIRPCRVVETEPDGREHIETCEPEQAEFWTVYTLDSEGMAHALADYDTEAAALASLTTTGGAT